MIRYKTRLDVYSIPNILILEHFFRKKHIGCAINNVMSISIIKIHTRKGFADDKT